jgi:EAL domain-containing protein (putative c-di-GMP-specific phosphodiesterase class I)
VIPNYLKIKGSFIRDAKNDRSKWIFVKMMNDTARRLKIKSIAKYVEFETTLGKLREIGVDFAQGCSFGEPATRTRCLSIGNEAQIFGKAYRKGRCRTFFDRSADWKSRPFSETGATPRTRKER